jgi:peptidyl-dipeptidase A
MQNRDLINYWIWESWRWAIGPNIRELYPQLVNVTNIGARNADYNNVGAQWQREMEIDDVEALMHDLLDEIQPFYNMLHAFVKSILVKQFKSIDRNDINMPAHLLGWNANWYHLLKDYIEPEIFSRNASTLTKPISASTAWNIDDMLRRKGWSSHNVVKRIEDFYTSLGLSKMSKVFWDKSFISNDINMSCHGTAANMYEDNDFRMIVCGFQRIYDLYVITHEMGHVEQYVLSQKKQAAFQPGNPVIQETIGDSIFLALMTPMHLSRLRLIDELNLFPPDNVNFDLHQLMIMALMKVPELPFAYLFETFRYNLFAERIDMENSNDYFWDLTRKYQRIVPPNIDINRHQLFDISAKFHFAANVPYAKYFFANILQYQVFRGLCEVTIYGKVDGYADLDMPLHKCDIYGSRRAGKLLR